MTIETMLDTVRQDWYVQRPRYYQEWLTTHYTDDWEGVWEAGFLAALEMACAARETPECFFRWAAEILDAQRGSAR